MIIVTGGVGFIGSAFVWKLNEEGVTDILIVDELDSSSKWKNLVNRQYRDYIYKDDFIKTLQAGGLSKKDVSALIHMGACSSTTEQNAEYMMSNNYNYTKTLAEWAIRNNVRFIYASSGATYGDGSRGYSDDDKNTLNLKPMNIYGYSKQFFDLWAIKNKLQDKIAGIKFFNVFGPNEYHKEDMRSVVNKAYHQVLETGKIRLFKSFTKEFKDGEQKRDFVYVKDCVNIMYWILNHGKISGIFNLGTGNAKTWNDLARAVFRALDKKEQIEYIPMPESLQKQYQNYTCADMRKLRGAGCKYKFTSLEDSIKDYIQNYLLKPDPYL